METYNLLLLTNYFVSKLIKRENRTKNITRKVFIGQNKAKI